MTDPQIASWLSSESAAWVSIGVPALIALSAVVFVVIACIRHGRQERGSDAAPREPQRSVRSAGVVFFSR